MAERVPVPDNIRLDEFVTEYLNSHGYPDLTAKGSYDIHYRFFDDKSVDVMLDRGTDRNSASMVYYPEQRKALEDAGLGPRDFIHSSPWVLSGREQLDNGKALAVYDAQKLRRVPRGAHMYTPKSPHIFSDALVAVFVSEKKLKLEAE